MKTNYLLPSWTKKIGWILFLPGLLFSFYIVQTEFKFSFLDWEPFAIYTLPIFGEGGWFTRAENNWTDEISSILALLGGIMVAFSKLKNEDEFISKIRLESLVWAVYVNYIILIFAIIFIYDMGFFWVLLANMFTTLLVFITRFYWKLYQVKSELNYEE